MREHVKLAGNMYRSIYLYFSSWVDSSFTYPNFLSWFFRISGNPQYPWNFRMFLFFWISWFSGISGYPRIFPTSRFFLWCHDFLEFSGLLGAPELSGCLVFSNIMVFQNIWVPLNVSDVSSRFHVFPGLLGTPFFPHVLFLLDNMNFWNSSVATR